MIKTLSKDPIMKSLIDKYGELSLTGSKNYFNDLVSKIIGQLLSGKAADAIYKRFLALVDGELTAERVLALDDEKMRGAGLSYNKITYIKNIAKAAMDKSLLLDKFGDMTDTEIIGQLTVIKGIGEWTAEMFLIFSLGRLDIFSKGDGGLKRAVNNLYGNGAELSAKERLMIAERWKPYRSIASLYLWRSLENR